MSHFSNIQHKLGIHIPQLSCGDVSVVLIMIVNDNLELWPGMLRLVVRMRCRLVLEGRAGWSWYMRSLFQRPDWCRP